MKAGWRTILFFTMLQPAGALSATTPAASQVAEPSGQTVEDVLHRFSDEAGVIFIGQVLFVRRANQGGVSSGIMEIQFRVDSAVRGCTAGTPYVLREWGGLWAADAYRYRVGQRLLMFLYAPGPSGLTSPVEGLDGAVPIRMGGAATSTAESTETPAIPYVDLRWLGTRLPRTVSFSQDAVAPARNVRSVQPVVQTEKASARVGGISAPIPDASGGGSVPAQQASVDFVFSVLTKWQKVQHGTP
jgi:hypothetical protein